MHNSGRRIRPSTVAPRVLAVGIWLALQLASRPVLADDWAFFRGPDHNGISQETEWLSQWPSEGPRVAWRRELGIGVSSFAVVGNRVFTMGSQKDADTETVWCLDADRGDVVWQFTFPCEFDDHYFEGGTLSTPTVDGAFVYALSYDGQLHCLSLERGELIWRRHLVDDFQGRRSSWDYAGSPLVAGDRLILDSGSDGNSTLALNKRSGEKIWGSGDDLAGYATPIPFDYLGTSAVLVFKARALVAQDLQTGRELWRIGWRTKYDVNASSPTVLQDKLFVSSGYGGRRARGALFQLLPDQPQQLWVNDDIETKMNSAVLYQGHVYCVSERAGGQLMCVSCQDGSTVWSESQFAPYGTLLLAGGKLLVLDELGDLIIADATPQGYRECARTHLLEPRCWSMPVLANGRIYARNNNGSMVCLDVRLTN